MSCSSYRAAIRHRQQSANHCGAAVPGVMTRYRSLHQTPATTVQWLPRDCCDKPLVDRSEATAVVIDAQRDAAAVVSRWRCRLSYRRWLR
jgi:hypothetical protein